MERAIVKVEGGEYMVDIEFWRGNEENPQHNKYKAYDVNGTYIGWVYEEEIVKYIEEDDNVEEMDM